MRIGPALLRRGLAAFAFVAAALSPAAAQSTDPRPYDFMFLPLADSALLHDRDRLFKLTDAERDAIDAAARDAMGARRCIAPGPSGYARGSVSILPEIADHAPVVVTDAFRWFVAQGLAYPRTLAYRPKPFPGANQTLADGYNLLSCGPRKTLFAATWQCGGDPAAADLTIIEIGEAMNVLAPPERRPTLDLALSHELGHVFQRNARPVYRCVTFASSADTWLDEGAPDAAALLYLKRERYKSSIADLYALPFANRYARRFYELREYDDPLDRPLGRRVKISSTPGYRTNGFWVHVAERYFGADLEEFNRLYALSMIPDVLPQVDALLRDVVPNKKIVGLQHIFPQFLAEMAQYAKGGRYSGKGVTDAELIDHVFGGCAELSVGDVGVASWSGEINPMAGECVEISFNFSRPRTALSFLYTAQQGGDRNFVDNIQVAIAEITVGGKSVFDCYRTAQGEAGKSGGGEATPCLTAPSQQRSAAGRERVNSIHIASARSGRVRLVLTNTPADPKASGADFSKAKAVVTLKAAADGAQFDGKAAEPYMDGKLGAGAHGLSAVGSAFTARAEDTLDQVAVRRFDAAGDLMPLMELAGVRKLEEFALQATDLAAWSRGLPSQTTRPVVGGLVGSNGLAIRLKRPAEYQRLTTTEALVEGELDGERYLKAQHDEAFNGAVRIVKADFDQMVFAGEATLCLFPRGHRPSPPSMRPEPGEMFVYTRSGDCATTLKTVSFDASVAFPRPQAWKNFMAFETTEAAVDLWRLSEGAKPGILFGPYADGRGGGLLGEAGPDDSRAGAAAGGAGAAPGGDTCGTLTGEAREACRICDTLHPMLQDVCRDAAKSP
ncbi:MAG: hypothetical protein AAGC56_13925 [Pseudomonadota bacterium]